MYKFRYTAHVTVTCNTVLADNADEASAIVEAACKRLLTDYPELLATLRTEIETAHHEAI